MRYKHLLALVPLVAAILLLIFSVSALGYDQDTHYYLTFYLALETGCWDWWGSWVIASADWSQDLNHTTVSEKSVLQVMKSLLGKRPNVPNQRNWHAFVERGREEERFKRQQELWERVEQENDQSKQLVYLGQLLHFVQDSFAHHGYGPGLGHGLASILGNDPDTLHNKQRETQMVKATTEFLLQTCDQLGRTHEMVASIERRVEPLMDGLIRPSSLGWRFSSREADSAIVRENIQTLGQAVEEHSIPQCWATIVGNWGNELVRRQGLIPSPIQIEYDRNGKPANLEAVRNYVDDVKSSVQNCDEERLERLYRRTARAHQPILLDKTTDWRVPLGILIWIITLVAF